MKKSRSRNITIIISIVLFFFFAAGVAAYFLSGNSERAITFETVNVEKGTVVNTVTATGTLEATNTVVVGTQVSGVIKKLFVDYNSIVTKGQILATIDKSILQSNLENAEAAMYNAQAELDYQKSNFERMKLVFDKGMLSNKDYDLALYQFKKAEAAYKSAKANMNKASLNLSYATIYSPIDGMVLNRAVDEGQTVAASVNAPELFTITNNLIEMQVEANVDEADIGMVKKNQRVEFTVDAFPDKSFSGTVTEVRLKPKSTSNVITYMVIVSAQNPTLELKPGMTASITIYVQEVTDVLVLAGKALRFTPDRKLLKDYIKVQPDSQGRGAGQRGVNRQKMTGQTGDENSEIAEGEDRSERGERGDRAERGVRGNQSERGERGNRSERGAGGGQSEIGDQSERGAKREMAENRKIVYVKNGDEIKPTRIKTGVTDGTNIEILSGLKVGDEVVTAMNLSEKKTTVKTKKETQNSPFVPQRSGRGPGGR